MLTRQQMTANIEAMEKQGASQQEIQEWLDSLGKQASVNQPQANKVQPLTRIDKPSAMDTVKNTVQGIGNFLGMGALAKSLGLAAFKITPEGKDLEKAINSGKASNEQLKAYADIYGEMPSTGQVLGSAVETAANIATAGIGGAAKSGAFKLAKTASQGVAKTVAQSGIASAALGAGQAMGKGKNPLEVAKESFTQGLTGAATVGAISGLGKVISKTAQGLPEKLYNSALQVNKKMLMQEKSPAKFLIDKGIFGTMGKVINESQKSITALDDVIDKKLATSAKTIDSAAIRKQIVDRLKVNFGKAYSENQLAEIVNGLPLDALKKGGGINVVEANELRKQLDRVLGESYFMSDKQAPVLKEAIGAATSALRNAVKSASGTAKEFGDLSKFIKARDLALGAAAQADKYWGIGFKDLLIGGIATGGGNLLSGAAAIGVKKAITSPVAKTGAAVFMDKANKVITKLPTDEMGRLNRTAVLNALKEIFGSSEN